MYPGWSSGSDSTEVLWVVPSLFLPHPWLPLSLPSCVDACRGLEQSLWKLTQRRQCALQPFPHCWWFRFSSASISAPAFSLNFLLLLAHLWVPFLLLLFFSVLVPTGLWSHAFIPKSPRKSFLLLLCFSYFHLVEAPFKHFNSSRNSLINQADRVEFLLFLQNRAFNPELFGKFSLKICQLSTASSPFLSASRGSA